MSATRSRRSTSAASYNESEAAPVRTALSELRIILAKAEEGVSPELSASCLRHITSLRQLLSEQEKPNRIQDAFRNFNGFRILADLLSNAPKFLLKNDGKEVPKHKSFDLCEDAIALLRDALSGHWGNRRYFQRKVDTGGWLVLQQVLEEYLQRWDDLGKDAETVRHRLFGQLLACCLEDDTVSDLFLKFEAAIHDQNPSMVDVPELTAFGEKIILRTINAPISVYNPDVFLILLNLWSDRPSKEQTSRSLEFLPLVLRIVACCSTHNLLAVHGTTLLTRGLAMLQRNSFPELIMNEMQRLCTDLLKLGISQMEDAQLLYGNIASSSRIAAALSDALRAADGIPYIHFNLSLHGYSSVELTDLGRTFPPPASTSPGYTLAVWIQVVEFDLESHTTIFGAFDASQTCFILVYLEKDTKNIILQTSVTSSKPSVRFKSFEFEVGRWYHVCIVHRRPGVTSSSRASLFVDGEFVEQVKAHFPSPPPAGPTSDNTEPASPNRKHGAVQSFLGTPRNLAPKLGKGQSSSHWRLASACLFDDALSDDLIAVHRELGPRYYGNYQDCLGGFQTYEASASLNLRNETLHPGKEEKSTIVAAIRSKASELLPESKFLLNICPSAVLHDDEHYIRGQAQIVKGLSKASAKNLRHWTRSGRSSVAINGAIPSINKALVHMCGVAFLTGDPAVVVPQALDDATWRLGGCGPIGLALVEAAESNDELKRALDIIFAVVKGSWRNSEAMERENGFGILASLLSAKLANINETANILVPGAAKEAKPQSLMLDVLLKILNFVGYEPDSPENSVINNPLAYRILLVDLDIWRSAAPEVQQLYYQQFTVFSVGSKHHLFNSKRLSRMRITKKWLGALKGDVFYPETLEYFLTAFRSLLNNSLTAEAHRSIALYITYAVHKGKEKGGSLRYAKPAGKQGPGFAPLARRSTAPIGSTSINVSRSIDGKSLSRSEVGVKMLDTYTELLCQRDTTNVKKFARTVTNKWLLHLFTDENPEVVMLSTKILGRVLTVNGSSYVDKFSSKTGGFVIMQHRLKRWWHVPQIWLVCFAILFGCDIWRLDFRKPFDLYALLSNFPPADVKVVYPGVIPVLMAMLQTGLKSIMQDQPDPESPSLRVASNLVSRGLSNGDRTNRSRASTFQNAKDSPMVPNFSRLQHSEGIKMLETVTRFLSDLHANSPTFRDYAALSNYVQELLYLLFPLVVSSDVVSPETELNSRGSALNFDGQDVVIRPLSQTSQRGAPIVRTTSVENTPSPELSKAKPLKRGSSYILITAEEPQYRPSTARLEPIASPKSKKVVTMNVSHRLVEEVLEIVIAVFTDQILARKDFQGIGLFMKVPPGFQEHQAYFQSFILRNTISNLENTIKLDDKLISAPRVLTNLQKFCTHLDEAVFEGWFIGGAEIALDFLGEVLEYLQRPDIKQLKSVRLCSEVINSLHAIVSKIALLRLSEPDDSAEEKKTVTFLNKLSYWQTVLFNPDAPQEEFLKLFSYLLYTKLVSEHYAVREVAANLWRTLLVQKPDETAGVLQRVMGGDDSRISRGFQKVLEVDNDNFLNWIDEHRIELDAIFLGRLNGIWENFTIAENRATENNYRARIVKRQERLKLWVNEGLIREDILRRHELNANHWKANIYTAEHLKRQRALQDQQDGIAFNLASWTDLQKDLYRPFGLLYTGEAFKSKLDMTEGRNRMRLRLLPDQDAEQHSYKPKRSVSKTPRNLEANPKLANGDDALTPSPTAEAFKTDEKPETPGHDATIENVEGEDDFEIVEDPDSENFEDKNRKVMRSLQRGDQVEHVYNVSRIVGLEACEGLLIVGKNAFYLIDYYFQRTDGEIVDVWEAPNDERDSYMQMISGRQDGMSIPKLTSGHHEARSWRWDDVLSISKRRFLFRDVAIEVFFLDGQSYLLTVSTAKLRDDLYSKLLGKAQNIPNSLSSTSAEDTWRVESLRSTEDSPQTLGSRFTNVFAQGTANPATKRWVRGEISNFQYLMLVNTMAGRTFNDLTQYPVFPWVLADYTSKELDLTNPRSFRDLTKPMGAQTPDRQAEFRDRYQSFAEMGDENAPPFHYGTHYSSAMIVTGYLIRLQPFVQSYLLLQGGKFDHPDRLFYSIEKAWASASQENMTDVRELIPEFFYLPEMFMNGNEYNFGERQGNGGSVDNVALPPWAKGDPKIFVAKHREALESEYVSRYLHQWIDLVFGHKQRGEAALEATNVFHHLSYRGAKNLDDIADPVERIATIGIIHNFGQTPHQVFQRAHPAKETSKSIPKRLDYLVDTLTRLTLPLLELKERLTNITYSQRDERLLCTGPLRLNVPPEFDKFVEWGYTDGSLRFYQTESNKVRIARSIMGQTKPFQLVSLFEHVHSSQISTATFVDHSTLVTAGMDCSILVWTVANSRKLVDLIPRGSLFGHRASIIHLATSRSFSSLLSAGSDGTALLWDLNRLKLVRVISQGGPIECIGINDVTGTILICRGQRIGLYTLNGELLLEQQACAENDEVITCCAFFEGTGNEYLSRNLIFTGHKHGTVNVWNMIVHDGSFILEHVKRLNHADSSGFNISSAITCVLPLAQKVYTGDEDGRVFEWSCIQRQ